MAAPQPIPPTPQPIPPTPPESFCFAIKSVQPNYEVEERRFSNPPDTLWIPPTRKEAFTIVAETRWHYWDNGSVSGVPPEKLGQIKPYSTTSMFWGNDRQAFLHVPCDCTAVSVKNAKGGREKDMLLDWAKISFCHKRVVNRCLSLIGYHYEKNELGAKGSPYWMPQLLPEVYQYAGVPEYEGSCLLAGDLSVLLSLAAFSIEPQPQMQIIGRLLQKTSQGTEWHRHQHIGKGSKTKAYRPGFKG